MKIFVISDTHFNHTNIIKLCNRPFTSVEEMNRTIIRNWNSVVSNDDIVYHLGDFSWGDPRRFLEKLNRKEIHLILGNHDRKKHCWLEKFNSVQKHKIIEVNNKSVLLIHHPIWKEMYKNKFLSTEHYDFCLHGHTHNKEDNTECHKFKNICVEKTNYFPVIIETCLGE